MSKCIRCGKETGETSEVLCNECDMDVGGDAVNNWEELNKEILNMLRRWHK